MEGTAPAWIKELEAVGYLEMCGGGRMTPMSLYSRPSEPVAAKGMRLKQHSVRHGSCSYPPCWVPSVTGKQTRGGGMGGVAPFWFKATNTRLRALQVSLSSSEGYTIGRAAQETKIREYRRGHSVSLACA